MPAIFNRAGIKMKNISMLFCFLPVIAKIIIFLLLVFPVIMFYVYLLMSLHSNEMFGFGFFITSDFAVSVSVIISLAVLTIKVMLYDKNWVSENANTDKMKNNDVLCAVVKKSEGGILKRIDENRELLDLLNVAAPGFIDNHPWVIEWFKSQDDFLLKIANELKIKIPEDMNYPRPFNGNGSGMGDKMFTIETYRTEEEIGRLVKEYMVKTNGMPLQIVFPEYDRGE